MFASRPFQRKRRAMRSVTTMCAFAHDNRRMARGFRGKGKEANIPTTLEAVVLEELRRLARDGRSCARAWPSRSEWRACVGAHAVVPVPVPVPV